MKNIRKRLMESGHVQQEDIYDMMDAFSKFSEGSFQFLYLFHYNIVDCILPSAYSLQSDSDLLAKTLNWTVTQNSRAKYPNANKANHGKSTQERSLTVSSTEMS